MTRIDELLTAVAEWAHDEPNVRAAFVVGSQARAETPADEWSDVDVVVLADDPAAIVDDADWLRRFGEPELTFVETTAVGGERERRVLFADGLEVDFAVFPAAAAPVLLADSEAAATIARGYRVLHDELGLAAAFAAASPAPPPRRPPEEVASDFWYHALWTAKKWRRGEAIAARSCLESVLKPLLLEVARLDLPGDTWHGTRFVERWAPEGVVEAWWQASPAAPDELPAAVRALAAVFARYSPHAKAEARLEELLR